MDYEDYETPLKFRSAPLGEYNAHFGSNEMQAIDVVLSPNDFFIDDNITGIPGIGAKPQSGTYLTVD